MWDICTKCAKNVRFSTNISHIYLQRRGKLLEIVDEEQQTVGDVHLTDAGIEVNAEQIHVGVELLDAAFHTSGDDVVGDATERLERDDVIDTVFGKFRHLGRE